MTPTSRGLILKTARTQSQVIETDQDRFWGNMTNRIKGGTVIPILSNNLIYDMIFGKLLVDSASEAEDNPELKPTGMNVLAANWANEVQYPFPDSTNLAAVAQYVRSQSRAAGNAKDSFVRYSKQFLLAFAGSYGTSEDTINELTQAIDQYTFTELADQELGLLKYGPGSDDPLSILASLPLPLYITTSYYDVLERALAKVDKHPISQTCFWSGPVNVADEHKAISQFNPDPEKPVVYHLFGMERYPLTMVLTEDDYLDFLVQAVLGQGKSDSVIPLYVQAVLSVSWLMLIGYRLQDWDFRTIFRGVINSRARQDVAFLNTIIQLSLTDQYLLPKDAEADDLRNSLAQAQKYLQDYFSPLAFEIRWSDPASFLNEMYKEFKDRS